MTIADIQNKIYFYTKTNSSSFVNADMLIAINAAYNYVAALLLQADNRWQWDDTNQTDLPVGTTSLSSGQQDYSLATTHLTIDRVEVQDTGGNWTELVQIDQQALKGDKSVALETYLATNGIPIQYRVVGNSLFLYPTPNYSQAASLKVYFTRGPVQFLSTDLSGGTAVPGFNSLFHDLIPLFVAYDYAIANGLQSAAGFQTLIQAKQQAILDFYGNRDRDSRVRMTTGGSSTNGVLSGWLGLQGGDSNR